MIKVKWFNKDEEKPKISIKVEGSLEVKSPSYDSYEEYVKSKKKEALKKEVTNHVENLLKDPNKVMYPFSPIDAYRLSDLRGFARAQDELVKIIMKEIEID